jgi:putative PIN family toxin of toxin-antitoxin system
VRAVLDVNVLVSAALSRTGAPAELVARWLGGGFELVVSPALLEELGRALAYPKVSQRVTKTEADALVALLRERAILGDDPSDPPRRSSEAGDDYLLALAEGERAVLVTGDDHLLELEDELPISRPRAFLESLQ